MIKRVVQDLSRNQTGEVSHVAHQQSTNFVGNLQEAKMQ
jgi:hypothetical protein